MAGRIEYREHYLKELRLTFRDKAWFLKHVAGCTTLVDFGCADGSFLEYLKKKGAPFTSMFGVENDAEFAKLCAKRGFCVRPTLGDFMEYDGRRRPESTVVVMNSVWHELADSDKVWNALGVLGPKYIAVRDMNIQLDASRLTFTDEKRFLQRVGDLDLVRKLDQHCEFFNDTWDPWSIVHFLMKYFHDMNWCNENLENYDNLDMKWFIRTARSLGYDVAYENHYMLPWLRRKWRLDFGGEGMEGFQMFLDGVRTHVKILLVKQEI